MKPPAPEPHFALLWYRDPAPPGMIKVRVDQGGESWVLQRSYVLVRAGYGEQGRMARAAQAVHEWATAAHRLPRPLDPMTLAYLIRLGYEKEVPVMRGSLAELSTQYFKSDLP